MKVINVRDREKNDPTVVYCGRASYGWQGSVMYNPFSHFAKANVPYIVGTRDIAVECWKQYLWAAMNGYPKVTLIHEVLCKQDKDKRKTVDVLLTREEVETFFEDLTEDSVLGCWCHPSPCHCDVIVKAWEWWKNQKEN